MDTIEKHKAELKEFQDELKLVYQRKRYLVSMIENTVKIIDELESPVIISAPTTSQVLWNRDMRICVDFIEKHERVTSRQIIDHLNMNLKNLSTRWKNELDGNLFMNYMGKRLSENQRIKSYKDPDKKTITWWEIK